MNKDLSGDDEDIPPMTAPVSGPGTSESEQDDAMKWLESLAQKQGAKAEELITNPNERTENAPDWVAKVDEAAPAKPAVVPPASPAPTAAPSAPPARQPVVTAKFAPEPPAGFDDDAPLGELSPLTSGPGTTESEQDDAMKWLESLAQKQGAKAEELITNPQERTENAPGWVGQVENAPAAPVAPSTSASDQDDSMKWLEGLTGLQDTKPDETTSTPAAQPAAGAPPVDAAPAWVTESSTEAAPAPVAPPAPAASDQDDTMAWLQSLASGQPAQDSPAEAPAAVAPKSPWEPEIPAAPTESQPPAATAEPAADVADWLKSLEAQEQSAQVAAQPAAAPPSAQPADVTPPPSPAPVVPQPATAPIDQVPDWLSNMRPPAEQGQASQEDLPDWLKDQSADEQVPMPVATPAWEPAEPSAPPAPEPQLAVMEPPTTPVPAPEPVMPAAATTPPPPPMAATPPPAAAVEPAPAAPVAQPTQPPAAPRPAVRETGLLSDKDGPALQKARDLLAHGGLDAAVAEYAKLVKRGKLLEEVIFDLKEATYTHPVDVVVWQTLGDAHMRANQLQEALDAYTKAEELLR